MTDVSQNYSKEFFTSRNILLVVLMVGVSFALRYYFMQFREIIDIDGAYYTMLGKNLFSGNGYTEPEGIYQWYYPPFFPVNIGLVWLVIRDVQAAGEWTSLLYGALLPIVIWYIGCLIYDLYTGIIAGWLTVFFVPFIEFSSSTTAEMIFVFYTILFAIVGYVLAFKDKVSLFLLLGVLSGLLYLIKPAGIQYIGVAALILFLGAWYHKWNKTKLIKASVLLIVGWACLSVPYLIYLHNHHGYWTLNELSSRNAYRSVLMSNNENKEKEYQLTDDKKEMVYFTSDTYTGKHLGMLKIISEDPRRFVYRYFRNFIMQIKRIFTMGHHRMIGLLMVPLLFLGLLKIKWDSQGIFNISFLTAILLPFFTYPLVSSEADRWLLPFLAIFILWYARGILVLQTRVASSDWLNTKGHFVNFVKHFGIYLIVFTVLVFEMSALISKSIELQQHYYPLEHKEMGEFLMKNKISPDTVLMSVTPHVAFYAQTKQRTTPWGNYSDIISYAKYKKVDYLVIDETYTPRRRPQLAFLLHDDSSSPELTLVYKIRGPNKKKIFLYKLMEETI